MLQALWRHVDASLAGVGRSSLWACRREGKRPAVWPSVARLAALVGRSPRTVHDALRALELRGLIASEDVTGDDGARDVSLRLLFDPEGVDGGVRRAAEGECEEPQGGGAARRTGVEDELAATPAPAPAGPSAGAPVLRLVTAGRRRGVEQGESAAAAEASPVRHAALGECGVAQGPGAPRRTGFEDGDQQEVSPAAWAEQRLQQRPAATSAGDAAPPARPAAAVLAATPTGETAPAGRRWDAVELLAELNAVELPAPAQRIAVTCRSTLERARRLLLVDAEAIAHLPIDAGERAYAEALREARRQRYEHVQATALAFADLCRERRPDQRRFWCGAALETRPRPAREPGGATPPSRWQCLEDTVAADLAAQAEAAAREAAASRKREREEDEQRQIFSRDIDAMEAMTRDFLQRQRGA
ncbi:MAG: hypothetical protein JNL82_29790 [Myxococcales bacterium]|nr:hypothetical protein [Myxococcales bacterium]